MIMRKLQKIVKYGGLELPSFVYYYYAFDLRNLAHWALPPEMCSGRAQRLINIG